MSPEPQIDGRHARAEASRAKIARAMLDLIRGTGDIPTADQIAEYAGVSRRMVFRHFEDLESLRLEAIRMQRAEIMERFPLPLDTGPLDARIDALLDHRIAVYEHVMPILRVSERTKHLHRGDADADSRNNQRRHVAQLFRDHLPRRGKARDELLTALCLVSSWNAWAVLRDDEGMDKRSARAVIRRTLQGLFA